MTNPWIVIPARGGSRGVPRKNLRPLVGVPLIAHTIKTALQGTLAERVVVITDDAEISEVANYFGALVIMESKDASGLATLDQLIHHHLEDLANLGATSNDLLLTMQPTCPLITAARISEAVVQLEGGAGSVITVKDDRHLSWTIEDGEAKPIYQARVNRQLQPAQFRESGAIIGARIKDIEKNKTRIIEPVSLIELPENESLDIDTFSDLVVAEHWLTRKKIIIHADSSSALGMGHVYRALALAQELARHDLLILTTREHSLGSQFFDTKVFNHEQIENTNELVARASEFEADLVVLDVLDTEAKTVKALQANGAKVATFEDLGSGSEVADLTVSDLYPNPKLGSNQLTGVSSAILAPTFEVLEREAKVQADVTSILVLFGGTDPAHLAEKSLNALEALGFKGKVTCVRGLGAKNIVQTFDLDLVVKRDVKNMAQLMADSDLALSSAGRTITELMSVGVPTICLCQNDKELTHQHATSENGVLNLGLGQEITAESLQKTIKELIADYQKRLAMKQLALAATASRSNAEVVSQILKKVGLA